MKSGNVATRNDLKFLSLALQLARRGRGATSPNPMVGAVLEKSGKIIGRGWHRRAGEAHAEIAALRDAQKRGHSVKGATLYVTLEPCCTHGRTPPCTAAIIGAGIKRVVAGTTDPNPRHSGRGFAILRRAGIEVIETGRWHDSASARLARRCAQLNEGFNHWIRHGTPFVTLKAAMTLDGKIATAQGESKWITGGQARALGMKLRGDADAILAGVNTIIADDPGLMLRKRGGGAGRMGKRRWRIVLDPLARTPLTARVVSDESAALTMVVVSRAAPRERIAALANRVNILAAPAPVGAARCRIDLRWLAKKLAAEN
ncbi:MAG: bifunctional diaminohydroxyphosphoribosylaminopyrimidine deaminase/5-amino-6-(5-phosphoribosylamino)uracil reductase RibD, partial [Verrucomicrobia bacterium]|nr:bifunctional diaminohydroxyphosphoribosylaminopyrimidine deaminase/5-amino-6-(5-phosphoribosylamino)uracil reductase RibD [Verrucomicrobiota bacterium]